LTRPKAMARMANTTPMNMPVKHQTVYVLGTIEGSH
jgi:hypothetical protein